MVGEYRVVGCGRMLGMGRGRTVRWHKCCPRVTQLAGELAQRSVIAEARGDRGRKRNR